MSKKSKEYVVYRGEELICIGTIDECSKVTGLKKSYLYWCSSKIGQERQEKLNAKNTLYVFPLDE